MVQQSRHRAGLSWAVCLEVSGEPLIHIPAVGQTVSPKVCDAVFLLDEKIAGTGVGSQPPKSRLHRLQSLHLPHAALSCSNEACARSYLVYIFSVFAQQLS